jgi:hypothetical protein
MTVWYNFLDAISMKKNFTAEMLTIVKYKNQYAKYKHGSGTKPAAPVTMRYYKLSQITSEMSTGNGVEVVKNADDSLTKMDYTLKLMSNLGKLVKICVVGIALFTGFIFN